MIASDKIMAAYLSDIQHKHLHISPSKDLGMLILCCAIANACVKQRCSTVLLLMLMVVREYDRVLKPV